VSEATRSTRKQKQYIQQPSQVQVKKRRLDDESVEQLLSDLLAENNVHGDDGGDDGGNLLAENNVHGGDGGDDGGNDCCPVDDWELPDSSAICLEEQNMYDENNDIEYNVYNVYNV
jgi:hypothetical protein